MATSKRRRTEGAPGATESGGDGDDIRGALERVLAHAEAQGEVYTGAVEDHATIRAALTDGELPADHREEAPPS